LKFLENIPANGCDEISRASAIQTVKPRNVGSINQTSSRFSVFSLLEKTKKTKILPQHFYKIVVYTC